MRGERDVYLKGDLDKPAQTDQEGNAATLRPTDGELAFRIGRSPTFIEGVKSCASATLGTPLYPALPDARTHALAPLASLDRWQIIDLAEDILDNGNFDYPRQRGAFEVTVAEDAERGACLQFTLKSSGKRPPYVPSYQRIDLKTPIEMPEQPTAIGLYVYGNGGWGRILIELCDAKGERWFSQGMPMAWNANDTESLSYIIHDDWRWMQIPVPGHYGSGYHWPRYCNWRNGLALIHVFQLPLKYQLQHHPHVQTVEALPPLAARLPATSTESRAAGRGHAETWHITRSRTPVDGARMRFDECPGMI